MLGPGSGAGIFWTVANVCATLAVLRGGQATTIATINCFSLITSGLWGLLWYRELKGRPAVAWAVAAAFTAAMSVLLSMEKGSYATAGCDKTFFGLSALSLLATRCRCADRPYPAIVQDGAEARARMCSEHDSTQRDADRRRHLVMRGDDLALILFVSSI